MGQNSFKITLTSPTHNFSFTGNIPVVVIGRSQKCDFIVPQEDLSREHCLFEIVDEQIYVTDLRSKNGVYVDGERIEPHKRTLINPGADVLLSRVYLLKYFPMALEVKGKSDFVKENVLSQFHGAQTKTMALELEDPKSKKGQGVRKKFRNESFPTWMKLSLAAGLVFFYLIYKIFSE